MMTYFSEHLQHIGTKQISQWAQVDFWHNIKVATFNKGAICHQGMQMWMSAALIAKGLDSYNTTSDTKVRIKKVEIQG